ncbi:hypothetical protein [Megamonas hypermegale]|uniref:hypothetical protein n=1 Tax=Megamonas hypermegale TaxID=158847 RepID=UPI0026EAD56E|nr:hypothetical protein [Megamonas hypermegale]
MNGQIIPLFEHAHILRTQMLTRLRDYAYSYSELEYEDTSDGIISGCKIATTEDRLILNQGLIHYGGHIYLITEPMFMEYHPTNTWCVFKICFLDADEANGYLCRGIEIHLAEDMNLESNEMELCRFKLQPGARLRTEYVDFFDRNTEFDTLITIHAPFCAVEKSSISPEITRAFVKEARLYEAEDLDISFFMQVLNTKGAVSREVIELYLSLRLRKDFSDCSNLDIFNAFCEILRSLQNGSKLDFSQKKQKRRQIIVC